MNLSETRALVDSMIRMYGLAKAFSLADKYAAACTSNNDAAGHSKWATAAAVIGELMDQQQRFGNV
jgi:hypothetical protein